MLYYIKPGDTLQRISNKFNTTPQAIMSANVICNPNYLTAGEPIIIPDSNINLPKSQGQGPYYITKFGDTFLCLSKQFNIPIENLIYMNKVNPNSIPTGYELLIESYMANPAELKEEWDSIGKKECDKLSEEKVHDIFYKGSFIWQALGMQSIPYLLQLFKNPCDIVRFYSIVSMGRIAPNNTTVNNALIAMEDDKSELVSTSAKLVLDRIELVQRYNKRMHITIVENRLYDSPNLKSDSLDLPIGSEVMSLSWAIPSPTGEKSATGAILIYDVVRMFSTGQDGFLPRLGLNEINVI